MSEKSSTSHRQLGRVAKIASHHADVVPKRHKRQYKWSALLGLPLWVLVAFVASQLLLVFILQIMDWAGVPLDSFVGASAAQTLVAAFVYTLSLAVTIGVPYLLWRRKTTLEELGLSRLVSWTDIGLSAIGFLVYGLLTTVVMMAVTSLFTGFPANQVQDTGFSAFGTRLDNLLAFATLVVIAPIAEEVLFRGYLYGKLKRYVPAVIAAVATSVLFGAVHMQWNVGIDVFVLGLVLCGLRSLTGSIWAGILVHMLKNSIAYYLLFVAPMIGG